MTNLDTILALNNAHAVETGPLERDELGHMLKGAFHFAIEGDSLNAAVATTVMAYELLNQARRGDPIKMKTYSAEQFPLHST